jgi:hypothetical protein
MSTSGRDRRRPLPDADPGLAGLIGSDAVASARRSLLVAIRRLPVGEWRPDRSEPEPGHLGYLIVAGLITRELQLAGAGSVELLGQGDLLRPWDEDAASFVDARWLVREPVELADLDRGVTTRLCEWPELVSAIAERGLRRSRSLAVHSAIESMRGLEDRLIALFWHLAERWGERAAGGVVVPLLLTHQSLSELIGARRPSVTTALGDLRRRDLLVRVEEGWILRGDPPTATGAPPAPGFPAPVSAR